METTTPEIMTISETCKYLRIPRSSLYKLAQEGKIPCQKVGRHWRFHRAALERWFEGIPGQVVIGSLKKHEDEFFATTPKD